RERITWCDRLRCPEDESDAAVSRKQPAPAASSKEQFSGGRPVRRVKQCAPCPVPDGSGSKPGGADKRGPCAVGSHHDERRNAKPHGAASHVDAADDRTFGNERATDEPAALDPRARGGR